MRVSIIVLCHNRYTLTERTLAAIRNNTSYKDYQICAVNAGSTDQTVELLDKNPNVDEVLHLPHVGICKAMNIAMSVYPNDFIVKLDNDAMPVDPTWLTAMVETYEALPNAGCVGHLVTMQKHKICGPVEVKGTAWHSRIGRHSVNGACWGMGSRTLDKIGMAHVFSSQYGLWDGQYCWRIRKAGFRLYYVFNPNWSGRSIENLQPEEKDPSEYTKWKINSVKINYPQYRAMKRKPVYVPNILWIDDESSPPNRQWIWMGNHKDADVQNKQGEPWPFVEGVFDRVENRR